MDGCCLTGQCRESLDSIDEYMLGIMFPVHRVGVAHFLKSDHSEFLYSF